MAQGTCSVDGCGKPVLARGWCSQHYARWYRVGSTDLPPVVKVQRICSVEDCEGPARSRGLCIKHWNRWYHYGSTELRDYWSSDRRAAYRARMINNQLARGNVLNRPSTAETYHATHWRINRELPGECAHCGSTRKLQASLRRDVPEERLLVGTGRAAGFKYSLSASDYVQLCHPCHMIYDNPDRRHPCERTAKRLAGHVEDWRGRFTTQELEAIQQAEKALRRVAADDLSIWPEEGKD